MQRRVRSQPNSFSKRVAVGNTAGTVPPAWRAAAAQQQSTQTQNHVVNENNARRRELQNHQAQSMGSKIILSQLPPDVTEGEVEQLFLSTVGPVYECYLAHNSQGRSKGVAIVHLQRAGDALEARRKYNGKIIDGRRPLKIELIVDPPPGALPKLFIKKERTLAERLSGPGTSTRANESGLYPPSAGQPPSPPPSPLRRAVNPRRLTARVKARIVKRGPRRPNKSAMELDREMESYMAARKATKAAPGSSA